MLSVACLALGLAAPLAEVPGLGSLTGKANPCDPRQKARMKAVEYACNTQYGDTLSRAVQAIPRLALPALELRTMRAVACVVLYQKINSMQR